MTMDSIWTHLIGLPCLKLSCSIIYSDNLSHGFGPWGHSLYAFVFSVTCIEQLNAQKLSANQGKPMKAFPSYSLMHSFTSFSVAHNETMLCFHYFFNLTHLWCMTGRELCWPGVEGEGRTAKKWTHPWSVSSALLGFQCSRCHDPGSVRHAHRYASARCCECTPHHLRAKDGSVWRKEREGQMLRFKEQWRLLQR